MPQRDYLLAVRAQIKIGNWVSVFHGNNMLRVMVMELHFCESEGIAKIRVANPFRLIRKLPKKHTFERYGQASCNSGHWIKAERVIQCAEKRDELVIHESKRERE